MEVDRWKSFETERFRYSLVFEDREQANCALILLRAPGPHSSSGRVMPRDPDQTFVPVVPRSVFACNVLGCIAPSFNYLRCPVRQPLYSLASQKFVSDFLKFHMRVRNLIIAWPAQHHGNEVLFFSRITDRARSLIWMQLVVSVRACPDKGVASLSLVSRGEILQETRRRRGNPSN